VLNCLFLCRVYGDTSQAEVVMSCLKIKQGHRICILDVGVFSRKLNNRKILNVIYKFLLW